MNNSFTAPSAHSSSSSWVGVETEAEDLVGQSLPEMENK